MDSQIAEFYNQKTIFLTGASGFLGRMIIEKLLRLTKVKRIYILMRPKRGMEIQKRIESFTGTFLFSEVSKTDPNYIDRISAIAGDCALPDLGLSHADRKLLIEEVQVVFHGAATVSFEEPLSSAVNINVRATRVLVQLAKTMPRLESFVYVSTAFSNCVLKRIDERFYPEIMTCTADQVLSLNEQLSSDLINKMAPALLEKFPNTYTYTKALAEQVVQREAGDLPICVFRPCMIMPTFKDPIKGWIDNFYGPISIIYGSGFGVLRVMIFNKEAKGNVVPADYCVSLTLASAWNTAQEAANRKLKMIEAPDPTIYNYVPTAENPIKWGKFMELLNSRKHLYAVNQMIWYPFLIATRNEKVFELWSAFYHHLPAFFIDTWLRLKGQKPRMKKIYSKIHKGIKNITPFGTIDWDFEMNNFDRLIQCMSLQDRELFQFDLKALNWSDYFDTSLYGCRVYLAKEPMTEESIRSGTKLFKRLYILNYLVHFIALSIPAGMVWCLLHLLNIV